MFLVFKLFNVYDFRPSFKVWCI